MDIVGFIFGALVVVVLIGLFAWVFGSTIDEVEKHYGGSVPLWFQLLLGLSIGSFPVIFVIVVFFPKETAKWLKSMDN